MDIVPKQAGKLEALNFVRESHGFATGNTIACGDSGNDILMLSGKARTKMHQFWIPMFALDYFRIILCSVIF